MLKFSYGEPSSITSNMFVFIFFELFQIDGRARLLDIEQAVVTVSGLFFSFFFFPIKWFTCISIYLQMISNDFDLFVIMRFTVDYC